MYSVTNIMVAILPASTPHYLQAGPYVYQEYDTYSNTTYNSTAGTVNATFNRHTVSMNNNDTIDTPIWQNNIATFTQWWRLQNQPDWKTYMQVLYSMVNEDQGAYLE